MFHEILRFSATISVVTGQSCLERYSIIRLSISPSNASLPMILNMISRYYMSLRDCYFIIVKYLAMLYHKSDHMRCHSMFNMDSSEPNQRALNPSQKGNRKATVQHV